MAYDTISVIIFFIAGAMILLKIISFVLKTIATIQNYKESISASSQRRKQQKKEKQLQSDDQEEEAPEEVLPSVDPEVSENI